MSAQRRLIACAACVACALGCAPEQRVVRYKPFFTGIAGAEHGTAPVVDRGITPRADASALADQQEELRVELPDGTVELRTTQIRHLIYHLSRTIADDEPELLYDQLVSDLTKEHFIGEDADPREGVASMLEDRDGVLELLGRLPMGEYTPSAVLKKEHPGYKISLRGIASRDLTYDELWIVMEGGEWKLWAVR